MANLFRQMARRWVRWRLGEDAYRERRAKESIEAWQAAGRPTPPPHAVKVAVVREYAAHHGCTSLIETGTYRGDMIAAALDRFERVHSIELAAHLHEAAKRRFADERGVVVHHGDSGEILGSVLATVTGPCLLWLDGHWSGGVTAQGEQPTPILRELDHVFSAEGLLPVVLIDDARCFGGEPDYPSLESLRERVHEARPDWVFEVEDDIIRTHAMESHPGGSD